MKELLNPTHKPGRSGKDLTHRRIFTAKAGELLPILCEEMVPNDYFEIDTSSLIRTFPLQTAAFLRGSMHFDFFFVPKTAVWRNFDNFYYQRPEKFSSLLKGSAYEPNITLERLSWETFRGSGTSKIPISPLDSQPARAKLLQLLGYGTTGFIDASEFTEDDGDYHAIKDKSLTVLPLMGYHRIYNMWYRNAWRDDPQIYDANIFSADSWDCSSYSTSLYDYNVDITNPYQPSICQLHYHPWFSDLFMGSLPNSQFGSVSSVNISGSGGTVSVTSLISASVDVTGSASGTTGFDASADSSGRWTKVDGTAFSGASQVTANAMYEPMNNLFVSGQSAIKHDHALTDVPVTGSGTVSGTATGTGTVSGTGSFDVLALRRALALQKWKEYNMRAGWKTRNQARAMFGVSTPEDRKHEIEFLKGYDFPLMIDEVINQSSTDLGELAGKGIGVGNGEKLTFSSGERHGYLYCIAYFLPQAEYDAKGIEKYLVRSEPFDHYVPAFENLGMEAIHRFELTMEGDTDSFNTVIGYSPRYHEYKTRVDKVYGEFMSGKSLSSWVSVRKDLQDIVGNLFGYIPVSMLYVNPSVLNTIFAATADGSLQTDQFLINTNITLKAVRPMSDLGLPNL